MKNKFFQRIAATVVFAVMIMLLLAGCGRLLKTSDGGRTWTYLEPRRDPAADSGHPTIELEFTPEPVEELPTGKPETGWKEAESVNLTEKIGEGQVHVRLYVEAGNSDTFLQGEVRAILETDAGTFDLGVVSYYGLHSTDIRYRDVNGDGRNELVITGGMGAAYGERKIIGYDPAKKRWVKLLTMGTPYDADIDGDGRDDVVAVSGGSLPGYVWIYRWNKDHFEKADVAASTGNTYAYVNRLDGKVWIEAGKWIAGKPSEPHYFQYRDGKLVEIPKPPIPQSR
ncbi:MAG: VCBS repeat-containing protein [Thermoanaerobacteraceae bacterium]|nr:VCBS repeat-containing protein [Thermoanaerobacteraceae bacterium]